MVPPQDSSDRNVNQAGEQSLDRDCERRLRRRMVERDIAARGIRDPLVLEAMLQTPRQAFVPSSLRERAYEDCALPIGFGQTISQPYTVAFMASALALQGSEHILEIGAGSGYAAAVLAHLAREVDTVERIADLADSARQRLARLGYRNVRVTTCDGTCGLPERAPFDAIVVTASSDHLPPTYLAQLAEGGRMLIPLGTPESQQMTLFTLRGDDLRREQLGSFGFVPLLGRYGQRLRNA